MLRERTVRLQYGSRVEAVYVLGTYLWTDVYSAAPAEAQTFSLKHSERVRVEVVRDGQAEEVATNGKQRWLLSPSTTLRVTMSQASAEASSDKVTVNYYEEEGNMPIDQAGLFLTAIEISLDVDADRDGVVEKNNPRKTRFSASVTSTSWAGGSSTTWSSTQAAPRSCCSLSKACVFPTRASQAWSPSTSACWSTWPSMKDNYLFLKEVKNLVEKTNCELKVCFQYVNRGDRWIQDEVEFGYIEAPHKGFPVVLDSPRDGNLKDFPVKQLLGPDFGYVTREPLFEPVTSLDSFGNLEVSPPVTVNGKTYPLGRILIGSSFPLSGGRRMTKVVRDFLQAQQVQAPVELYSDWLTVGHVDEFMTFVPIPGTKEFRMLMASTSACYKLFREKQREGHGEAIMFKGLGGMSSKRITINKILSNENLVQENQYFQRCLDWNRDILKKELGLTEQDIIDLPALFKMDEDRQARAYFPNMVNMIVLDKDLGIPKPFGPQVEEVCCLETHVRSLLEPLGLCCTFVDDISAYHKFLGEVHCGTNVRRKPFSFKWWHMVP
ncbi:PREDICTED: protein-arginine deiminase type-2 isoform X2 [Odobenus rosmarus divergens]|uniref:Protein-arginine deiminase type-2 isoform X2 n=1 Tax=Odobenus rosmarus divergens TaxID=9708 RepID=A0A2U3VPQ0_ODORO|nr:PREDICTED: protein-arginine deiminase type-2 isoform X2 [Odobenus rosmarus divergens]